MKFIYRTFDGTFTESAQAMLTNVFGDYAFYTNCVGADGILAVNHHTNKPEKWSFVKGEDFSGWCVRCFPDNAHFEGIAE